MKVTLTRVTQKPVEAIEEAACNCYNSQPTGGKIMKSCYNSGHHAVLEFCDFTFHVEGVSRALTHQLVRHRLASYAQRSQRYCGENGFEYITPSTITGIPDAEEKYHQMMKTIDNLYTDLQDYGLPNEDCRYILPNACTTCIEIKMNFRTLIHFMNERLCARAQWEIRLLARAMKKCIEEQYPELAKYLVPKCEVHEGMPFCTEHSTCGRHPKLKEVYKEYKDPKRRLLENMIQDVKSGVLTDTDLAAVFMETFCQG